MERPSWRRPLSRSRLQSIERCRRTPRLSNKPIGVPLWLPRVLPLKCAAYAYFIFGAGYSSLYPELVYMAKKLNKNGFFPDLTTTCFSAAQWLFLAGWLQSEWWMVDCILLRLICECGLCFTSASFYTLPRDSHSAVFGFVVTTVKQLLWRPFPFGFNFKILGVTLAILIGVEKQQVGSCMPLVTVRSPHFAAVGRLRDTDTTLHTHFPNYGLHVLDIFSKYSCRVFSQACGVSCRFQSSRAF